MEMELKRLRTLYIVCALAAALAAPVLASAAVLSRPANNLALVGYWALNEGSGSTAKDSSGSGNTGTLVNSPSWVPGKIGDALSFNTSNYVNIGTPAALEGLQVPVTITAWFKQSSTSGLQTIYGGYSGTSGGDLWSMVRIDSGTLKYYTTNSGGEYQSFGSFTPAAGQWHFVAVTVSGSLASPTVTITMDGQNQSGSLSALDTTPNTSVDIQIGHNTGPGEGFNGLVDEVHVYRRALTASEVAALYEPSSATIHAALLSGNNSLSGSLTASWSFDSSTVSGTSVADQSGNGHTLTLENSATITTGHSGQALTLNGTNQYAYGLIGALPTSVALSMWVKPNDVSTEQAILTEEGDGAPSSGYHFTLVGILGGKFYGGFWDIGDIAGLDTLTVGQWYHVILTYDGVHNTQSLYVDGVLQGTQSGTWSPPSDIYFLPGYQQQSCSFTSASGHCGDLAHYFNGQIDDLQGYDQAFTSNDVKELSGGPTATLNAPASILTRGSMITNGLVGYWPFDGSDFSGTSITDRSGSGYTATNNGATKVIGKLGQALSFNGASNYLSASLPSLSDYTVSFWAKPSNCGTSGEIQFFDSPDDNVGVSCETDGVIANWAGGSSYPITGSDVWHNGQWIYVTVTSQGGSNKIYINGSLSASGTAGNSFSSGTGYIGQVNGGGRYYGGIIDDFRLYNRALSASEVKILYDLEN